MDIFRDVDHYRNLFSEERLYPRLRRTLRNLQDPYDMDEQDFKRRYRFNQDVVKNFILPIIIHELIKPDSRGNPVAPEFQILVCLRFYATGSFQIVCGDLLHISQPTVSKIITKISRLLAFKNKQYIRYPSGINMIAEIKRKFKNLGQYNNCPGFNNIEGAIDCTHIKIVHTPRIQHNEAYRNRKSYFSINVQAVAGPDGQFLNIVARWAGSTHDSRIFQLSTLNMRYREGHHSGLLVGDSGYPSLPFLLTPINPPTNPAEERYNQVHSHTRNIVERMFGMWKRRFPCLSRGLGNSLETVSNIIVSCAILHNLAIFIRDPLPEDVLPDDEIQSNDLSDTITSGTIDGFAMRQSIVNLYS